MTGHLWFSGGTTKTVRACATRVVALRDDDRPSGGRSTGTDREMLGCANGDPPPSTVDQPFPLESTEDTTYRFDRCAGHVGDVLTRQRHLNEDVFAARLTELSGKPIERRGYTLIE